MPSEFHQQHFMQHQDIMTENMGQGFYIQPNITSINTPSLYSSINITIYKYTKSQEILFLPKESPKQHISTPCQSQNDHRSSDIKKIYTRKNERTDKSRSWNSFPKNLLQNMLQTTKK